MYFALLKPVSSCIIMGNACNVLVVSILPSKDASRAGSFEKAGGSLELLSGNKELTQQGLAIFRLLRIGASKD